MTSVHYGQKGMAEFAVVETWSKSVSSSPRPPPCAPFYFVRFPPMGCHSPSWKRVFPFSYSSVEISQPPPEVYFTNLFQIQSHWQSGLTILQVNDVPLGIFQATSLGSSSPYPTTSFPVFITVKGESWATEQSWQDDIRCYIAWSSEIQAGAGKNTGAAAW